MKRAHSQRYCLEGRRTRSREAEGGAVRRQYGVTCSGCEARTGTANANRGATHCTVPPLRRGTLRKRKTGSDTKQRTETLHGLWCCGKGKRDRNKLYISPKTKKKATSKQMVASSFTKNKRFHGNQSLTARRRGRTTADGGGGRAGGRRRNERRKGGGKGTGARKNKTGRVPPARWRIGCGRSLRLRAHLVF